MGKLRSLLFGKPLNPLNPQSGRSIALIAFLAWVGLGADALSSSCYGPEQAYLALSGHAYLSLYVAMMTVVTVFIISIGYNQVIELFPSGGGGYQIASKLLHPYAGLVTGCALLVDYVLTISVSVAGGTDAIFSFFPKSYLSYKVPVEVTIVITILVMNMRGMKEAIKVLLPIFLLFVFFHIGLLIFGFMNSARGVFVAVPEAFKQTDSLIQQVGMLSVIGFILHAFSLGGGTFTGLEAVSNNVQRLAEPRIKTGKRTTLYMALSLSIMAGGIMLLYLFWGVSHVPGQTLNAVLFHKMLGDSSLGKALLFITLVSEAGLLFVAANTGFAAGPFVLGNMAVDNWVPNRFRHLSSRLVVQNGLILFGIGAIILLLLTSGNLYILVVLYSINVFLSFSITFFGITVYWIQNRTNPLWVWHWILSGLAFLITISILIITLFYKFKGGGWLTIIITTTLIIICLLIKRHYQYVAKTIHHLDKSIYQQLHESKSELYAINPQSKTAVIFVNQLSVGLHALLAVLRLFPNVFENFVFISSGTVDIESFKGGDELVLLQKEVNERLNYFVRYCNQLGFPAESYVSFGIDTVKELKHLSDLVMKKYPHVVFFSSQLVFKKENLLHRFLHSHTPLILQHYLHFKGQELMILPMRI